MKNALFILAIIIFPSILIAQCNFGSTFYVGTSLTYIWHNENEMYVPRYNEYTWNVNAAIQISKRLDMGVQAMAIFMKPEGGTSDNHHILGIFGQYHFLKKEKVKIFAETSFNTGNYKLSNKNYYPQHEEGIYYIGFGGGLELKISHKIPHLFLDLSFINYEPLNIEESQAYTQYIVGLNYRFGKGYVE